MNNFYLLVPPISEEGYAVPERNQHTTVKSSASNNNLTTNVGDKLLVMHSKGPDYEGIIPNIAKGYYAGCCVTICCINSPTGERRCD